jgi:hypothetical protein
MPELLFPLVDILVLFILIVSDLILSQLQEKQVYKLCSKKLAVEMFPRLSLQQAS